MKKGLIATFMVALMMVTVLSAVFTVNAVSTSDDTTPPVTTHVLDPAVPDGLNGWYVNDVNVTLNATDDISGVKEIKFRVDGGAVQTITGDNGTFIMDDDGEDIEVEYWAIDNVGNEETHHTLEVDIDQTSPWVDLYYDVIVVENDTFIVEFIANADDDTSRLHRVEFYVGDELYGIQYGLGGGFAWEIHMEFDIFIYGFINYRSITEEYVKFLAIDVSWEYQIFPDNGYRAYAYDNAGNYDYDVIPKPPPELPNKEKYKWFTFSNDYFGYIGRHFIFAYFEDEPISVTPGAYIPNLENTRLTNRIPFHTLFLRLIERFPLLNLLLQRLRI